MQRIQWRRIQRHTHVAAEAGKPSKGMAEAAKNTSLTSVGPTGTEATCPFITTRLPAPSPLHFTQWHQQHAIFAEPDDFRHHGTRGPPRVISGTSRPEVNGP